MQPLRASGAYRWMRCAAAPSFGAAVPTPETNDAAREGTCAAWVAECCFNSETVGLTADDFEGETAPNGWAVDSEMVFHVNRYLAAVRSRGGRPFAEQELILFGGLVVGHCDAANVVGNSLIIDDLKYGHDVIEARGNVQLLTYAAGFLANTAWDQAYLYIYQPRSAHPAGIHRGYLYTRAQIEAHAAALYTAALATREPQPVATPGDWCADCPAAATCNALALTGYRFADTIRDRTRFDMPDDQLGAELDFLDRAATLIAARRTAVVAEATARIKSHHVIPSPSEGFYSLETGWGNRVWKYDPALIALATGKATTRVVPRTPAELEREGVDVSPYVTRSQTQPKLKRITSEDMERKFHRG